MSKTNSPRRWVIKAGSSLITNHGRGLDYPFIENWVDQVMKLRQQGVECVIVTSGAVAEGLVRLNWKERPKNLHELQAAAAIGQMGLVQAYESQFKKYGVVTAQILLTHDDLSNRKRYLNARSTIRTLLSLGAVPIINENDTVVTDEIKFGDNDTLAALVANLIEAQRLILLTDQQGMFAEDPRQNPNARFIAKAEAGDPELERMASGGTAGKFGRGGMVTKVRAAARAARSGALTVIAPGKTTDILERIVNDAPDSGTWLHPAQNPIAARKQWLAGHLQVKGKVTLDNGAVDVLKKSGSSLLPVGVVAVEGHFQRGEAVECVDGSGKRIACGLANYSADDTRKILRQPTSKIEAILGYIDEPELIHRDNMVVL